MVSVQLLRRFGLLVFVGRNQRSHEKLAQLRLALIRTALIEINARFLRRFAILHSPRGRLRYADRLRRPRWRNGQP
jgi:hypothetical protein